MNYVHPLIGSFVLTAVAVCADPPAASLTLTDQFEKTRDLKEFRGDVVVVLYGDRKATDANRALGEKLHVAYHPTAKGLPPARAHKAPPSAVPGLPAGARSPDVHVVPVACTGKAPEFVLGFLRRELKKASPDVPVWIDAGTVMKDTFGQREGEPNLVVIDAAGRLRYRVLGEPDAKTTARLIEIVDYLRKEAAGVK
ncbi:MAG TPA: hypothetical protein VM597_14975 [Gemmataceae bacterium]|jgi:hypothetical protein|nr:hypothetical protein [Gemmataceae bacterium]